MKIQHSPVNPDFWSDYIDEIDTSKILSDYNSLFGIDIRKFIENKTVKRYRCTQTGLEFYKGIRPGDGKFYSQLMKNDWYYNPWKWEHKVAKELLRPEDKLLEIGCGSGSFLEGLKDIGIQGKGIEINTDAVQIALKNGLDVTSEDLKLFANQNENSFDWTVSFQVLEHIEDVGSFLTNAIKILKPGGKLIICVPNNDSFIGKMHNPLNLPPHHVNRWNKESLQKIAPIFGLEFCKFEIEPLQAYHHNWYINSILEKNKNSYSNQLPIIRGIVYRTTKKILQNWISVESNNIVGHSILAIYTKT